MEVVRKPAYSLNLYAAMGLCDGFERDDSAEEAELSFTAPEARILIVDDNAINLSVAKGVIEPLGMQVDTACSAQEAIEMVRSCRYDIVFMDHMMPEIDGIEATHMIRSQFPSYASVPIIALTASVSGGARDMFLKEGLNDFIAKPIELRDMINKIRRWLSEEKIVPISNQPPAARLKEAGNNNDLDYISRHTNAMLIEYLRLKQEMGKYFSDVTPGGLLRRTFAGRLRESAENQRHADPLDACHQGGDRPLPGNAGSSGRDGLASYRRCYREDVRAQVRR